MHVPDRRYTVIAPLDPVDMGQLIMPAHVKLVPWFGTQESHVDVVAAVESSLKDVSPFTIVGGPEAYMSNDDDRRIRLVGRYGTLRALHGQLLHDLRALDPRFLQPGHIGDGYMPHVSLVSEGRRRWLRLHEETEISQIGVAMRHESAGRILARIDLGQQHA